MRLTKIRHFYSIAGAIALASLASNAVGATIVDWTFETLPASPAVVTAGPYTAETGVNATGSEATGGTGGGTTVGTYSSPAGNGDGNTSLHSYSSNGWDVGDFWQFKFSTVGATGMTLSFDTAGSATGPKNFKVQTSTDGSSYTDLPSGAYTVAASTWNTNATPMTGFTSTFSLPATLENLSAAYIRLVDTSAATGGAINGGNVGTGGTSRVDNFKVSTVDVPEPCSALLVVCGLAGFGLGRRR